MQSIIRLEKLEDYHYPFEKQDPTLQRHEEKKSESEPSSEDEKNDPSTQDDKSSGSDTDDHEFGCATELILGLRKLNLKIYLLGDELPALITKKRFEKLFDVAVIGFYHTQHVGKNFPVVLKDSNSLVYIELPKN